MIKIKFLSRHQQQQDGISKWETERKDNAQLENGLTDSIKNTY